MNLQLPIDRDLLKYEINYVLKIQLYVDHMKSKGKSLEGFTGWDATEYANRLIRDHGGLGEEYLIGLMEAEGMVAKPKSRKEATATASALPDAAVPSGISAANEIDETGSEEEFYYAEGDEPEPDTDLVSLASSGGEPAAVESSKSETVTNVLRSVPDNVLDIGQHEVDDRFETAVANLRRHQNVSYDGRWFRDAQGRYMCKLCIENAVLPIYVADRPQGVGAHSRGSHTGESVSFADELAVLFPTYDPDAVQHEEVENLALKTHYEPTEPVQEQVAVVAEDDVESIVEQAVEAPEDFNKHRILYAEESVPEAAEGQPELAQASDDPNWKPYADPASHAAIMARLDQMETNIVTALLVLISMKPEQQEALYQKFGKDRVGVLTDILLR